ncbi:MAG: hypothetical protein AAB903_03260 [Patescibacteria group bacterium]
MKTKIFLLLAFLLLGSSAPPILAQTTSQTTLFLTWKSNTYTPSRYEGKALPTTGSRLSYSVAAFSGGKPLSLKDKSIRWHEQGQFKKAGVGMEFLETEVNVLSGNEFKMRVEIPDLPGGTFSKTITLRVVRPKVIIEAPFPNLRILPKDFSVKATPYFFSVFTENSLIYRWLVNTTALAGGTDPQIVKISKSNMIQSANQSFSFRVTAENPNLYVDKGEGQKTINVQASSQ